MRIDAGLAEDEKIAEGVVEHWRGVVERLDEEAAEKAAIEKNAEMERRGEAGRKRVRAVAAIIDKLAGELSWLQAEQEAFSEYNKTRGGLPFVADSEVRVREIPGHTVAAEYRDELVWVDGAGNSPSILRDGPDGLIPVEMGFTRKTVRVQTRAEQIVTLPSRLADAITLVGLDGRKF